MHEPTLKLSFLKYLHYKWINFHNAFNLNYTEANKTWGDIYLCRFLILFWSMHLNYLKFLRTLIKQNITSFRQAFTRHTDWLLQVLQKLLLSALIYGVLGDASGILHPCWCCGHSHWCLIWSFGVWTRTPSHMWGRLYLPSITLVSITFPTYGMDV